MNAITLLLVGSLAFATALPAELTNAKIESSMAKGSLSQRIELESSKADGALWIAYEVPGKPSGYEICCGSRRSGTSCELDRRDGGMQIHNRPRLGTQELTVYLRVQEGSIQRVRVFSEGCRVNAEGRRVLWMQGINGDDSVATLRELSLANAPASDDAIAAMALHASPDADRALEELAASAHAFGTRSDAVFWLGNIRGQAGFHALERVLEARPESRLRGEIAFALSESPVPEALDSLIDLAQSDSSPEVRGEAIFWLAQRGGIRAEEVILRAVTADTHDDVRDEAIFALSELPDGAGVDRLIQVVRSNDMPRSARKEAMFWLAESNDPRAMEFFEKVLWN